MLRLAGNRSERAVVDALEAEGWHVVKSGWPDFLATRDDEVRWVEAKPKKGKLSPAQQEVADILASLGIEVEVIHTDLGELPAPRPRAQSPEDALAAYRAHKAKHYPKLK